MKRFVAIAFTLTCVSANAENMGTVKGFVRNFLTDEPITTGSVLITISGLSYPPAPIDGTGQFNEAVSWSGGAGGVACVMQTSGTGFIEQTKDDVLFPAGIVVGNFGLLPGDSISGTVTDSTTGLPISTGSVLVFASAGTLLGSAPTDNAGSYNYGGLIDGTYYARADALGYVDDLWNGVSCPHGNCALTLGTPIVVPTSGTTNSIANFQLIRDLDYIFSNDFEAAL